MTNTYRALQTYDSTKNDHAIQADSSTKEEVKEVPVNEWIKIADKETYGEQYGSTLLRLLKELQVSKNQIYGRDLLVGFMSSNPLESMYDAADDDSADPVNIISEVILLPLE